MTVSETPSRSACGRSRAGSPGTFDENLQICRDAVVAVEGDARWADGSLEQHMMTSISARIDAAETYRRSKPEPIVDRWQPSGWAKHSIMRVK